MSRLWLLPEQQKREFRVDHLNPGHPTAEQFLIAPAKGRNVSQPVTREEALVFVNDGILPARLEEWEDKLYLVQKNYRKLIFQKVQILYTTLKF